MKKGNALALISRIREKGNNLIVNELEKKGIKGIAPSHGDILVALYKKKTLSMNKIAANIKRTNATVTVLIDKLIKKGYIEKKKSNNDKRVTNVILTKKGESFKPIFIEISEKLNNRIYGSLTKGEKILLEELLEKVNGNF